MATLLWISSGLFHFRAQQIEDATKRISEVDRDTRYYPHPHPPYQFLDVPPSETSGLVDGLRLRTVMVSNVPPQLRSEVELKRYFEYFMSRPLDKPSISAIPPGFFNKSLAYLFNRAKRIPAHSTNGNVGTEQPNTNSENVPVIDRVVIARRMTELSSLLERREDVLARLEAAHLKLAQKALIAVMHAIDPKEPKKSLNRAESTKHYPIQDGVVDVERGESQQATASGEDARLIEALAPYVEEFNLRHSTNSLSKPSALSKYKYAFRKLRVQGSDDGDNIDTEMTPATSPQSGSPPKSQRKTIWEALLGLDRHLLDHYQPLINLTHLFRDKKVPAIDYYTAKLGFLNAMITENRAKAASDFPPVSTAFVTFADPLDARRACKYLAVHPDNPLTCMTTMAPMYADIDWIRVMKSNIRVEVGLVIL
jgi:Cytosolic domain of 10TM putative phosphate transporter